MAYDLGLTCDYRSAAIATLAAQRLSRRGVDTDLFDLVIRVGFAESFVPEVTRGCG